MLLNLTKKIDKLCKYIENIVKYDQFGLYNMLGGKQEEKYVNQEKITQTPIF